MVDCCILESVGSKPMNNLYFACTSCKVFVDAGYRWAYCTLEEVGAVKRGEIVQPGSVLAAEEYWTPEPGENSKWLLDEVLPSVRSFLQEHGTHRIVFDEGDVFYEAGPDWFLEWIQVGYLADPLPRFCLERLKCESWMAVCEYMNHVKYKPSWWTDREERERAERWYKARLIRTQEDPRLFG